MKHYCKDANEVLAQVNSTRNGLTAAEAQKRLDTNGKNKLAEAKKDSILVQFLKQLTDPMIIILLVAALISGVLAVWEGESMTDVVIIPLTEETEAMASCSPSFAMATAAVCSLR